MTTNYLNITVHQYQVELYTGSESEAGTDANVSLQIFGQRGDTGVRKLMGSKTNENKFEQGKVKDHFTPVTSPSTKKNFFFFLHPYFLSVPELKYFPLYLIGLRSQN